MVLGGNWVSFCWVCAAGLSEPLPHYILFYSVANYRPHVNHFWANMLFSRSQLSHFLFLWIDPFFRLNEEPFTFHLRDKHSGTFAGRMKNCLTPTNPKMCDPIQVTLLKMLPHYSQSSRENVTPSSSTSPLASYQEVPPPTPQAHGDNSSYLLYPCAIKLLFMRMPPLAEQITLCL